MKKSAVALVLVLYCFALGEGAVRLLYAPMRRPFYDYDMEMWRYSKDLKQALPYYKLPFHHYPNREGVYYGVSLKTNSLGFRDREYGIRKPLQTKRIVVLGDSQTLGWGVTLEKTFAKRLESMLDRPEKPLEVINMGIGNYNSVMEAELFKLKGLQLDPDMVILAYYVNDAEKTPTRRNFLVHALLEHSYFVAFLMERSEKLRLQLGIVFQRFDREHTWREYYRGLYTSRNKENLDANAKAVRELIALCRGRDVPVLIVNIPELHRLKEYPFPFATEHIRGLAQQEGAPFLDMLPKLSRHQPRSLWVSGEDDHANAKAHAIIARVIYEKILQEKGLASRLR